MIEVYKMLNGYDRVNIDNLFKLDTKRRAMGHQFKLKKKNYKRHWKILVHKLNCRSMEQSSSFHNIKQQLKYF